MRRSERELKDTNEILEFIREEDVMRLALNDAEGTYIVPVNFGCKYENDTLYLYFHGAQEGRKASILKSLSGSDAVVPFEIDGRHAAEIANGCSASYYYMSVMGNATVELLEGDDKITGLTAIMDCIMPADNYEFIDSALNSTLVCKLTVKSFTCKKH